MLKKGDPCYVRHEGIIKRAEYIEPSNIPKYHRVTIAFREYNYLLAVDYQPCTTDECRFVCMTRLNKGKENE